MMTKEELERYARINLLNRGQAEKDYFQNIILFILSQEYGKELVFKGGTALKKCYGLDRFSEDLDFTCLDKVNIKQLEDGLKRFNIEFESETEEYEDGLKIILRIRGPLFIGIRQSMCKFIIDFSFRENIILRPEIKSIGRFLEEIPQFDVLVMQEKEILAEKIRAVLTRAKARDVYDLWFLLKKGIAFDETLTNEKLKFYGQKWDTESFVKSLALKKTIWASELEPLVRRVPDFDNVRKDILERIIGK